MLLAMDPMRAMKIKTSNYGHPNHGNKEETSRRLDRSIIRLGCDPIRLGGCGGEMDSLYWIVIPSAVVL